MTAPGAGTGGGSHVEVTEHRFRGRHGHTIVYTLHRPLGPRAVAVIAHGMGEHGGRYDHVVDALTDAGFTVAVPDHVGHGRSGGKRMRIRRFGDFSDDLDRVVTDVERGGLPTFLIGHSMGGAIALDYALNHQDRLDGLVLSGAAVKPGDDLSAPMIALAKAIGRFVPAAPTLQLDSKGISRDPAVIAAYDADPLVYHGKIPAGLAGGLLAVMGSFPNRLGALHIPLLVMHGSDDAMANPEGSVMVERLAGSEDKTLIIWDDLKHEIFNEPEQEKVLSTMLTWLTDRIPAAGAS
ncbi:alpha/beta hydrolase [Gordonia sinesedis]